jgi:hypothetical protein
MFCYEPGCIFWVLIFIYELQPISIFSSDPHIALSSLKHAYYLVGSIIINWFCEHYVLLCGNIKYANDTQILQCCCLLYFIYNITL